MAGLLMRIRSRWPRAGPGPPRRPSARAAPALLVASFLQAFGVSPGMAQEPPDTVLAGDSLLVVVGSRAQIQDPVLLPVPVDIYGSEELSRLGDIDLGEALAKVAPSFNSTRLTVGDGAAFHVATLRGMNPDQVLVLINGKRRHGIAFAKVLSMLGMGTTGTDLRAIPIHAIERIEVLREGAASQYGSDAIAGVINVVLKDDAAGSTWSTYLGRTSFGDGERLSTSGNVGLALGERGGYLNFTGEYSRQTPSQRGGEAPTCFGPNPGYAPCADGGKVMYLSRNGEPDYEGGAVMANAALPVGETMELFAFGGFSRRSAVSDGLYRKADWVPRNVSYVYPDGFFPTEESDLTDASLAGGLRGEFDAWSAELGAGFGQGTFSFDVANSINPSYAAAQLARNPAASSAEIAAAAGPRSAHSGTLNLRQLHLNADAQRDLELGSTPGLLAVGAALRSESYWMEAGDPVSYGCGPANTAGSFPAAHELNVDGSEVASCGMQGYPGYSPQSAFESERDRLSVGVYADSEIKPMDEALALGGALRFENYSDAGSSLTAKLATRLELGESGPALRGAVSTGFRAPSLPQRGFNTLGFVGSSGGLSSNGFLPEGDPIACEDFGACSLGHETSMSLTGGLVFAHENGFQLTADYYRVAVKDAIALTEGLTAEHGLRGNAQFQGRPVDAVAFWTNAIDTRTRGFDVVAGWRFRGMDWGAADLSASLHRNETAITANRNPYFIRDTQTMLITQAQPGTRIAFSGDVRWASGFGARVRMRHMGSVMVPTVFEVPTGISGAALADVEITFTIDDRIRVGLGANNLFDKLPARLPDDHVAQLWSLNYAPESPYGIAGRITYLKLDVFGT
ncbi:MAG: TonB-dependent receptor [Gammaproteobacteria bacterium]|nr:TonB-dependent receptor [Gammaproteobacteria bacterium]